MNSIKYAYAKIICLSNWMNKMANRMRMAGIICPFFNESTKKPKTLIANAVLSSHRFIHISILSF